jgi:hypothetical protein
MLTNGFARNVGGIDRIVRALFALSVPVLYLTGMIGGLTALVLGVLAILILRTSFTGKCGIYYGLGLSTHRPSESASSPAARKS